MTVTGEAIYSDGSPWKLGLSDLQGALSNAINGFIDLRLFICDIGDVVKIRCKGLSSE